MEIDLETRRANRAEVVRLLRSGKYRQISRQLTDGCDGRCVLGVVCEALGFPLGGYGQNNLAYTALQDYGIDVVNLYQQNDSGDYDFTDFADYIVICDGYAGI